MHKAATLSRAFILLSASAWAQQATFQAPASYPAEEGTLSLTTGDFNGDGKADVAIANTIANTVTVYLSSGSSLQAGVSYDAPENCAPNSVSTGDFKRDGEVDLLAVCYNDQAVVVFPGTGTGTFGSGVETTLPFYVLAGNYFTDNAVPPAVADFDGDGQLDLALLDGTNATSNGATIFKGQGDGTFIQGSAVALNSSTLSAVAADFNRDGIPDLAFTSGDYGTDGQSVGVALGQGGGVFAAPHSYSIDSGFDLLAGDVNSDGIPDIVTFDGYSTPSVTVLTGDGKGNFSQSFHYAGEAGFVNLFLSLADIRGIGAPDIVEITEQVASESDVYPFTDFELTVFPNDGSGGFGSPYTIALPPDFFATGFGAADLNSDGLPDLALSGVPPASGVQSIADLPAGMVDILLNTTPRPPLGFSNVNGASFFGGPVASNSIVSAFGSGFPDTAVVSVKDSSGASHSAQVFYSSATQVNYAIPNSAATGRGTVTIAGGSQTFTAIIPIVTVTPGVFGANGLAAGSFDTYQNGKEVSSTNLVTKTSSGQLIPTPINVGTGSQQVFLILYGTGLRNHKNPVTAQIGNTNLPASYAGAQGTFVSEDQINVLLPQSLKGAGVVNVVLNVDGQTTNPVQIQIQ